jgi:hypothetical protein
MHRTILENYVPEITLDSARDERVSVLLSTCLSHSSGRRRDWPGDTVAANYL